MLRDMAKDRYEQNILLPILKSYEADVPEDKYLFYFNKLVERIVFDQYPDIEDGKIVLCIAVKGNGGILNFIRNYIFLLFNKR